MPAFSKVLAALVLICPVGWGEWSDRFRSDDAEPIVSFTELSDGATITEPLRYGSIEVIASDPDAGTRNGAGIRRVHMLVVDVTTGEPVAARSEYWPTYDFGPPLPDGEYELIATAHAARWAGGGTAQASITVTVATDPDDPPTVPTTEPPTTAPPTTAPPTTAAPTTIPTTTPPTTTPPTTTPPTTTPPTTAAPTTAAPTTAAPTTAAPTTAPPTTAAPTTAAPTTAAPTVPASDNARANARSLQLLNELRGNLGLAPVSSDATMATFATNWSAEMTRTGFRHSSGPYAENIVWHSDASMTPEQAAEQFHQMWVDSPGHYANMTNGRWTLVGVGLYRDASGWWGTHVFQ